MIYFSILLLLFIKYITLYIHIFFCLTFINQMRWLFLKNYFSSSSFFLFNQIKANKKCLFPYHSFFFLLSFESRTQTKPASRFFFTKSLSCSKMPKRPFRKGPLHCKPNLKNPTLARFIFNLALKFHLKFIFTFLLHSPP